MVAPFGRAVVGGCVAGAVVSQAGPCYECIELAEVLSKLHSCAPQQVSLGSVCYVLAGTVAATLPEDPTIEIAGQLFAAFPVDAFPARLDRLRLIQLLNEPLSVKVPVLRPLYPWYRALHPELLSLTTAEQQLSLVVGSSKHCDRSGPWAYQVRLSTQGSTTFSAMTCLSMPASCWALMPPSAGVFQNVCLFCLFNSTGLAPDFDVLKAIISAYMSSALYNTQGLCCHHVAGA